MRPGPGSGVIASMGRTTAFSPSSSQLDRLVVGEPGRGIDRALLDRGALGEVGVLDDLDVVGRQAGRAEQRLEHDPARAVAARGADLLALQVGRRGDPRRRLGEDDVRELAVDGRDVLDRDAVADRRDDARPVADPDVDRALPDQRDEVRVDLVLELDLEAGIRVVALLLGEVELGELDARDVAEADDELGRRDARFGEAADAGPIGGSTAAGVAPPAAATATSGAMTRPATRAATTGWGGDAADDTGTSEWLGWVDGFNGRRRAGARRRRRRGRARSRRGRSSGASRT